jgi:hypothetical protein
MITQLSFTENDCTMIWNEPKERINLFWITTGKVALINVPVPSDKSFKK